MQITSLKVSLLFISLHSFLQITHALVGMNTKYLVTLESHQIWRIMESNSWKRLYSSSSISILSTYRLSSHSLTLQSNIQVNLQELLYLNEIHPVAQMFISLEEEQERFYLCTYLLSGWFSSPATTNQIWTFNGSNFHVIAGLQGVVITHIQD